MLDYFLVFIPWKFHRVDRGYIIAFIEISLRCLIAW